MVFGYNNPFPEPDAIMDNLLILHNKCSTRTSSSIQTRGLGMKYLLNKVASYVITVSYNENGTVSMSTFGFKEHEIAVSDGGDRKLMYQKMKNMVTTSNRAQFMRRHVVESGICEQLDKKYHSFIILKVDDNELPSMVGAFKDFEKIAAIRYAQKLPQVVPTTPPTSGTVALTLITNVGTTHSCVHVQPDHALCTPGFAPGFDRVHMDMRFITGRKWSIVMNNKLSFVYDDDLMMVPIDEVDITTDVDFTIDYSHAGIGDRSSEHLAGVFTMLGNVILNNTPYQPKSVRNRPGAGLGRTLVTLLNKEKFDISGIKAAFDMHSQRTIVTILNALDSIIRNLLYARWANRSCTYTHSMLPDAVFDDYSRTHTLPDVVPETRKAPTRKASTKKAPTKKASTKKASTKAKAETNESTPAVSAPVPVTTNKVDTANANESTPVPKAKETDHNYLYASLRHKPEEKDPFRRWMVKIEKQLTRLNGSLCIIRNLGTETTNGCFDMGPNNGVLMDTLESKLKAHIKSAERIGINHIKSSGQDTERFWCSTDAAIMFMNDWNTFGCTYKDDPEVGKITFEKLFPPTPNK